MKGIILLNGDGYDGSIDTKNSIVCCCDGAYKWANGKIKIDKNIGDFDSLDIIPTPPPEKIFPTEKDYTDGEIAIMQMLKEKVDEIEIYGGFGGREDHFIGNIHLLKRGKNEGVKCSLISQKTIVFIDSGVISLGQFVNLTISVFPFGGNLHIMGSEGLKYPYPNIIGYGECRGVSNIVLSKNAKLNVEGDALIIINRGNV